MNHLRFLAGERPYVGVKTKPLKQPTQPYRGADADTFSPSPIHFGESEKPRKKAPKILWFLLPLLGYLGYNYYANSLERQPTFIEPTLGFVSTEVKDGKQIARRGATEVVEDPLPDNVPKLSLTNVDSVLTKVKLGKVVKAIQDRSSYIPVYGFELRNGNIEYLMIPQDSKENERLRKGIEEAGLKMVDNAPEQGSSLLGFILNLLISILPIFLLVRLMRGSTSSTSKLLGGMDNKLVGEKPNVKFEDVQGIDEVRQELQHVVDYLKKSQDKKDKGTNPSQATQNVEDKKALKPKLPRGVLLVGPPGNGKTLLAKAVASEAEVPFYSLSGSDFVEMFVGVGASRVRSLFEKGKQNAPCVIFIDEIDAVGRQRGISVGGGHDEREQTLNQLLVEMDGFNSTEGVVLMAATNREDILDNALLRRFDKKIPVQKPWLTKSRVAILKVHADKQPLAPDVKLEEIAEITAGFSGSGLADLVEEATRLAAQRGAKEVHQEDFLIAWQNTLLGPGKPMDQLPPGVQEMTADHEGLGHALICHLLNIPVHIISSQPRGNTGGVTVMDQSAFNPLAETKYDLLRQLLITLGGMAAEEACYGAENVSGGASNDLQQATGLLQTMIGELGMFPKEFGLIVNSRDQYTGQRSFTEEQQRELETLTKKILDHAYTRVRQVIEKIPEGDRERLRAEMKANPIISGKAKVNDFYQNNLQESDLNSLKTILAEFLKEPVTPLNPPSAS